MDSRDIALVRANFRTVSYSAHSRGKLTNAFYGQLFGRDPALRQLFPPAMDVTRHRFILALQFILDSLDTPGAAEEFLEQLARDHRKYGVDAKHYRSAADALLIALRAHTGEALWTDPLDTAWTRFTDLIANSMIAGAEADDLPAHWEATVVGQHQLLDDLALVRLRADAPIPYESGQYLPIRIPQTPNMWRYLSPAIPANDGGELEFHVRKVRGGWVSPSIVNDTKPGDRWLIGAPLGGLHVDYECGRNVLMIGSGTGIAPLRAQVMEMARRGVNPQVHLFLGGVYPRDLYDLENMWRLSLINPWLSVIPVAEHQNNPWWHPEPPPETPPGMHRRLTGSIGHIVTSFGSWAEHQVQLAGSPEMVYTTTQTLIAAGVPEERISHDPLW
ncbi:FAD-binding oxidoreductase [Aldersonia sp. NBC_00410]|uniref:globin domain-containing protein n=1 Tax=Aldersonia sp. NBC_00410 TaxID=2975954 RepID=UPI002250C534|nr:globin domain-containing protein [Aldersonia sp. NBC_00410]MCX5042016.1 FAD-binding oxidoreductase [Aldersonia sp. NBC_00410]